MRLMRDLVGETLSERYRIVARIAGGGMGEVYRGHDLLLDRTVAVKVLQPSLATDPELVDRFRAEARAAARLNHPNVVLVHDWGSEDRTPFMVMEHVSGTDLRDILFGRGPLDPAHAVEIVTSVCDALQAAHREGLVHRDIKPENVLIARDGTVKVADFGIAAMADAERTLPGGGIMGTLRYLSPEQAAGGKATAASDIWAAGALLFELLTGTPPQGGTGAELLHRRASEPPVAPSELEADVPYELDQLVLRACAIEPGARFIDAAEMAAALRLVATKLQPRERPVRDLLVDVTDEVRLPDVTPPAPFGRKEMRGYRRRKVARRAGKVVLILAVVAALALGGWKGAGALLGPRELEVPTLVGMTAARAEAAAEEAGFTTEISDRVRHPDVPEGSVISQSPSNGLLTEGEAIGLIVSKGKPLVKVPDLSGLPRSKALKRIERLELALGDITTKFSLEVPADHVIEQSVSGKKIEQGSTVDLVLSKGPRQLAVPDVAGMKQGAAEAELTAAGFTVSVIEVYSDSIAPGRVVATTPGGGAEADEGSTVQLAISIGPEYEKVTMPDVRGKSVDKARSILEGMGLTVMVSQSCEGSIVQETDPLAGTKFRSDRTVTLFVCG